MAEFHRSDGGSRRVLVDYHVAVNIDVEDLCYDIEKAVKNVIPDDGEFGEFVLNSTSPKASGKLGWLFTGL